MSGLPFALDLSDPSACGVYRVANRDLDSVAALGRGAGLRVCRIDLHGCTGKAMLLMRLAAQLDFPASFGRNWDALNDGLRDLSWLPTTRGYALLLEDAGALQARAPEDVDVLLQILDEVAAAWAQDGLSFVAFLGGSQDPDAVADPD
ncbi:barstar family protein [Xanthomonas medicagonis]|uniref:barstar family protein n=1 Tax=Xanthomonas medicagonis TaxID=3160841 RepID=UPI003513B348